MTPPDHPAQRTHAVAFVPRRAISTSSTSRCAASPTARCSCGRCARESARAPRCSPTAARSTRDSRSTRPSARCGGTFSYPFRYGYSCVGRVEAVDRPIWPPVTSCSPSTRTRTGSSSPPSDVVPFDVHRPPAWRRSSRCRDRASRSRSTPARRPTSRSWCAGSAGSGCSAPCCCSGRRRRARQSNPLAWRRRWRELGIDVVAPATLADAVGRRDRRRGVAAGGRGQRQPGGAPRRSAAGPRRRRRWSRPGTAPSRSRCRSAAEFHRRRLHDPQHPGLDHPARSPPLDARSPRGRGPRLSTTLPLAALATARRSRSTRQPTPSPRSTRARPGCSTPRSAV